MSVKYDFTGKRALVTGAGKGIGRQTVKALCQSGATVTALSRTQEDLESLKAECPGISIAQVDLRNWADTQRVVQSCGDVDLLVNNAGANPVSSVLETSEDACDVLFDTNVKAIINVTQVVARNMVERKKGGSIVNLSSIAGQRSVPSNYVYCTTKAATDHLTRCQAVELGPHNIRVNAIFPTLVTSTAMAKASIEDDSSLVKILLERTPLGHLAEMSDIVNPILFLLTDSSAMISGNLVQVDGGYLST